MEIGKVSARILKKIIDKASVTPRRREVLLRPKIGEDCAVLNLLGEDLIVSQDPITGTSQNIGYLAVHINANDIASSGGEPIAIMLTVMLPPSTIEEDIFQIVEGAVKACKECNIEIIGGHTEITNTVTKPVISATIIGKTVNKQFVKTGGAVVGQDVIMTKWAAIEGTAILCGDYKDMLSKHIDIDEGLSLYKHISVLEDSRVAIKSGVTAMHDVTEGGILGACYEVAECSGVGISIELSNIPILEITKKVCDLVKINPYKLIGSGSLIMTAFDGENVIKELQEKGIHGAIIGKITESERSYIENGVRYSLEEPQSDELYKVAHD